MTPLLAQAGIAGRIQFVAGDVRIVGSDGKERPAQKGGEVLELDSIITAKDAQAQIKMVDGALIALRPETQLKLDAYVFDGKAIETEKAWFTLIKGGLRSLTGLIGKNNKERYAIRTPNAVIGIRGTDHEPVVILPDTIIAQGNPAGTYDKVNVGITSLTTSAGTTLIQRNQIGFAGAPNQAPVLLQKMPNFYISGAQPKVSVKSGEKNTTGNTDSTDGETSNKPAAQLREDTTLLAQREDRTTTPEPNLTASAQFANRTLSATNGTGSTVDASTQTLTDAAGIATIISLTPNVSNLRPDIAVSYLGNNTDVNMYLAAAQSVANSLNNGLNAIQQSQQSSEAARNTAFANTETAISAVNAATASAAAASAAGIPNNNEVLQQTLVATNKGQQALQQISQILKGENGLTGLVNLQQVSASGASEYARYMNDLQRWQKDNSEQNRLALQMDEQALAALSTKIAKIGKGEGDTGTALTQAIALAEAASAAASQAMVAANNIPSTDPRYAIFQATAAAAVSSAKEALQAVQAVQEALNLAQINYSAVNTVAKSTPSSIQIANLNSNAKGISNGNYGAKVAIAVDSNGNFVRGNATDYQALGPANHSIYYADDGKPQLLDMQKNAATGLAWGRWQGGKIVTEEQITGRDASGRVGLGAVDKTTGQFVLGAVDKNVTEQGQASLHWITGINAEPRRLAQSLTGVAHYTMLGGTRPTDNYGNTGVLNSATLSANFSTQSVSALLNLNFGNDVWRFGDTNIALDGSRFDARYCASCVLNQTANSLNILTKNGEQVNPNTKDSKSLSYAATISGSLMGLGLNSAGIQYSLTEPSSRAVTDPLTGQIYQVPTDHIIQGVVGFSGDKQNVNAQYRAVSADDGSGFVLANSGRSGQQASVTASIDYGSSATRLVDSIGGMDEFIGKARNYTAIDGSTPNYGQESAVTVKRGSATNTDLGSAKFGNTTVNWGRWQNGVVDIYSRDGSVKLGSINNQGRSLHWINTSASNTELATLPLTGSATYNNIGGTAPTDAKGNVGVLNSARVDVDFSAMRANTSIGVSFNSADNQSTWNLDVKNMPFARTDLGFNSSSANHGINGESHTLSCVGISCGNLNTSAI
ncbi:MAG: FecR domain-containing protein [Burkholderiales bacterium]|nr:FecR domain-containing protein [Burkholderiales bacterium]